MSERNRTVKNALVDIDSIPDEAGSNYSDWIKISKQQLQEREFHLLKMKTNKIVSIVKNQFKIQNFAIQQEIINNTYNVFCDKINQWKGVNVSLTKASFVSVYTQYFMIAKKYWDNKKRKCYGDIFWVRVFQCIEQFVNNDFHFLLNIINSLFNATFKCPNTKPCPLISCGALMCSNQIHTFLYNKHHLLNVKQWVINSNKDSQKGTKIINKLRNTLKYVISDLMATTNDRNTNIELKMDPVNQRQHVNHNVQIEPPIINNSNRNVPLNNGTVWQYQGIHSATHTVSDTRYTPLLLSPMYFANDPIYLIVHNNTGNISLGFIFYSSQH